MNTDEWSLHDHDEIIYVFNSSFQKWDDQGCGKSGNWQGARDILQT